jgi:hypothetical protein
MKPLTLGLFFVIMLALAPAPTRAMDVIEGLITTQVSGRQPVDRVQSYPATAEKLFCFTRIVGAAEGDRVFHVWYWGEQEMARVELPVRSSDWRTWSSKSLLPGWAGNWRVEVVDAEDRLLLTIPFVLL